MAVHIDEIESTVDVEPAATGTTGSADASTRSWAPLDRTRHLIERAERDENRTEAWDFDD